MNIPLRIQDTTVGKSYKFLESDFVIKVKRIDSDHVYGDIYNMNSPNTILLDVGFWYNEIVVLI